MSPILFAAIVAVPLLFVAIRLLRGRQATHLDDPSRITSRQTLARLEALVRAGQDADSHVTARR